MTPKQLTTCLELLLGQPGTAREGIQQVEVVLQAAARMMYRRGMKDAKIASVFYECADRFAAPPPQKDEIS